MKNMVKFVNDNTLEAEGIGNVMIMRKDGKRSVISNVLYIPCMKRNFLGIAQLVEKNYKMSIKDKMMRVINVNGRLILKGPLSQNTSFEHLSSCNFYFAHLSFSFYFPKILNNQHKP